MCKLIRFKKTLIVEQNREYVIHIREMLSGITDNIFFCLDGKEAVQLYDDHKPDLILVEAILPKLDGFAILEHIEKSGLTHVKIMLTSINQDIIIKKAFELGADYLFVKPYDRETFAKRICDVRDYKLYGGRRPPLSQAEDLRTQITNTLKEFGIPAKIKGYSYLREALLIACDNFSVLSSINKNIYKVLAARFDTTDKCVERNIRHAIETSANRGDIEAYYRYFGFSVDSNKGKPTNGEFIAAIADKILLQKG